MFLRKRVILGSILVLAGLLANSASAQKAGDGSATQRLEVMRQKLETIRRSANSAASALKQEGGDEKKGSDEKKSGDEKKSKKGGDKEVLDTPYARLKGIEKEAAKLANDVNNLRGKVDRSEKFEASEVDRFEADVEDIRRRADAIQTETAGARANPASAVGTEREVKKKKKFLGIFGGGGNDEFDELIGTVTPGRDRELFIVATREVRKKNFDVGRLLFQTDHHYIS
jgi:hypothetical protein